MCQCEDNGVFVSLALQNMCLLVGRWMVQGDTKPSDGSFYGDSKSGNKHNSKNETSFETGPFQ